MLEPDTILQDRYRIAEQLGGGGMGDVYLAYDMRLADKRCAIKQLTSNPDLSPEERAEDAELFRREAATLAHLNHPNLPDVSDYFEREDSFYLVMEYVEGETLSHRLDDAPEGLPIEEILDWAFQLCDVLDYLHSQDPPVIFRDLKPANIMITKDERIKLIDFGIVRLFDPTKGTDTLKMGTAGYAPPEQYAGQGQTTPRSDIYAFGVTLHELLTGDDPTAHPFVFTPPGRLRKGVSASLSNVIMRAVDVDPDQRFPSAKTMKAALEKATHPRGFTLPFLRPKRERQTQTATMPTGELPATQARPPLLVRFLKGTARLLGTALLAVTLTALILILVTTFGLSFFAERAIASGDWYLESNARSHYVVEEAVITEDVQDAIEPYLFDAIHDPSIDFAAPDEVGLHLDLNQTPLTLYARVDVEDGIPEIMLERINDTPLYIVGGIISNGIRRGFESAWEDAEVYIDTLEVNEDTMIIELTPTSTSTAIPTSRPTLAPGKTRERDVDGMTMVYVPAGAFEMGSTRGSSDERPVHTVALDAFWLDQTEVTNAQFAAFLNEHDNQPEGDLAWLNLRSTDGLIYQPGDKFRPKSGYADHPVIKVSWYGAAAYCEWVGGRLPTEAEWEYAARGPDSLIYPWGDALDCAKGNFSSNCDPDSDELTAPVGSFPEGKSWIGAYNLSGNVWEWVADWYAKDYYTRSPKENPTGPHKGEYRVLRGGSWYDEVGSARSASRVMSDPSYTGGYLGFRCVVTISGKDA